MITNTQSGTNLNEIAAGHLPHQHPGRRSRAGRVQFQPVPGGGRRAAALPYRAAPHVPAGARGDRARAAARAAALRRAVALRGRRVRRAERVPRRRAAGGPVCGQVAAMVSVNDFADRAPRALADGEVLVPRPAHAALVRHAAHAARLGVRPDDRRARRARSSAATCSPRAARARLALTESDILGPSEAFREPMDYFAHAPTHRRDARAPGRAQARRRSPACTAAPGAATARRCCARSRPRSARRSLQRQAGAPPEPGFAPPARSSCFTTKLLCTIPY